LSFVQRKTYLAAQASRGLPKHFEVTQKTPCYSNGVEPL
jgi:hypothetical protein